MSILNSNSILTGSVDSFCLVCELHLRSDDDALLHVSKPIHGKNLDASSFLDKFKEDHVRKVKKGYYCEYCNIFMSTAAKVGPHVADQNHGKNKATKPLKRDGFGVLAFNKVFIPENAWHGLIDETCTVCDAEFENPEIHKTENAHVLKLVLIEIEFADENIYRKVDDSTFQCLTCNMVCAQKAMTTHFDSREHRDLYQLCCNADKAKANKPKETLNTVKDDKPIKEDENSKKEDIQETLEKEIPQSPEVEKPDEPTKRVFRPLLKLEVRRAKPCQGPCEDNIKLGKTDQDFWKALGAQDFVARDTTGAYWCILCNWAMDEDSLKVHMKSKHHITVLKLHTKRTEEKQIESDKEPEKKDSEEENKIKIQGAVKEFHKNNVLLNQARGLAFCRVCSKNIDFDFDFIKNHIDEHKKKPAKAAKFENLKPFTIGSNKSSPSTTHLSSATPKNDSKSKEEDSTACSKNDSECKQEKVSSAGSKNDYESQKEKNSSAGPKNDSESKKEDSSARPKNDSKSKNEKDSTACSKNDSECKQEKDSRAGSKNDYESKKEKNLSAGPKNDSESKKEDSSARPKNDSKSKNEKDSTACSKNDSESKKEKDSSAGHKKDSESKKEDSSAGPKNDAESKKEKDSSAGHKKDSEFKKEDSSARSKNDSKSIKEKDSSAGHKKDSESKKEDSSAGPKNDSESKKEKDSSAVHKKDSESKKEDSSARSKNDSESKKEKDLSAGHNKDSESKKEDSSAGPKNDSESKKEKDPSAGHKKDSESKKEDSSARSMNDSESKKEDSSARPKNDSKSKKEKDSSAGPKIDSESKKEKNSSAGPKNDSESKKEDSSARPKNDSKSKEEDSTACSKNDSECKQEKVSSAGSKNDYESQKEKNSSAGPKNDSESKKEDSSARPKNDSKSKNEKDSTACSKNDSECKQEKDSRAGSKNDYESKKEKNLSAGPKKDSESKKEDSSARPKNDSKSKNEKDSTACSKNDSECKQEKDSSVRSKRDSESKQEKDSTASCRSASKNDSEQELSSPPPKKPKKAKETAVASTREGESDIEIFSKLHDLNYNSNYNTAFCRVCVSKIPPALKSMKEHVKGASHKNKVAKVVVPNEAKIEKKPFCEFVSCFTTVENTLVKDVVINEQYCLNIKSFFLLTRHGPRLRCQACEVNLTKTMVEAHKQSPSHERAMKLASVMMFEKTEFIREIRPNIFHCGFCNVLESTWRNMESHLKATTHRESKVAAYWRVQEYTPLLMQNRGRIRMEYVGFNRMLMEQLNGND